MLTVIVIRAGNKASHYVLANCRTASGSERMHKQLEQDAKDASSIRSLLLAVLQCLHAATSDNTQAGFFKLTNRSSGPVIKVVARAMMTIITKIRADKIPRS